MGNAGFIASTVCPHRNPRHQALSPQLLRPKPLIRLTKCMSMMKELWALSHSLGEDPEMERNMVPKTLHSVFDLVLNTLKGSTF